MKTIQNTTGKYEFCPNGNYWKDVSGIFDTKIYLYCDCRHCVKKLYELRPIDITKKTTKESFERITKESKLEDVKRKINFTNMDKIDELLKTKQIKIYEKRRLISI